MTLGYRLWVFLKKYHLSIAMNETPLSSKIHTIFIKMQCKWKWIRILFFIKQLLILSYPHVIEDHLLFTFYDPCFDQLNF